MEDPIRTELMILRAIKGDDEAMGAVVQDWTPWLERSLSRWLREQEDVQEVAQSAWIEAWSCIGSLDEPRAFASWLRQIAFRTACTHLRKKKSPQSLPEDLAYEPVLAWLWSLLRDLAPAQAHVVRMHFEEGYTVNEIAGILAIPAGTVKSRLRLAKGILRRRLEEKK